MKSFKKLNLKLLIKICGLMILIFGLDLILKLVTVREGNSNEKMYGQKKIPRDKAGPNTDKANEIQARIEEQTQQSKANNKVTKATMPKHTQKPRN